MRKSLVFFAKFSLFFLLYSCKSNEQDNASAFTVSQSVFEDVLSVDGFVEPVETITLGCPSNCDGTITYLIADGAFVNAGDVVCTIEDKEMTKDYDEASVKLEQAKANLNKTKADLDMKYALLDAEVKNNANQSEIANLDSLQLSYLTPIQKRIKQLELEMVSIEKRKLEKKLKSLALINQSELKKIEVEITQLNNILQNSKQNVDALTLKAPQAGIVTRAQHFTGRKIQESDNVWGGRPVVQIPGMTKMKVRIYASEGNYKRIEVNDSVEFTFDAMPKNKGWGKILTKSPVGQPIKENSKVKVFEIEASIDKVLKIPEPGLTANCKIIISRIRNALVIPQICIFEQDSMSFVYVKQPNGYEMRQVLTGISSPQNAVIKTGLKLREKISFVKPNTALILKKTLIAKKKKQNGKKHNRSKLITAIS